MDIVKNYNITVRQLRERVKNNEYERLDGKTKEKLVTKKKVKLKIILKIQ